MDTTKIFKTLLLKLSFNLKVFFIDFQLFMFIPGDIAS